MLKEKVNSIAWTQTSALAIQSDIKEGGWSWVLREKPRFSVFVFIYMRQQGTKRLSLTLPRTAAWSSQGTPSQASVLTSVNCWSVITKPCSSSMAFWVHSNQKKDGRMSHKGKHNKHRGANIKWELGEWADSASRGLWNTIYCICHSDLLNGLCHERHMPTN